jgi:hypothetical protein
MTPDAVAAASSREGPLGTQRPVVQLQLLMMLRCSHSLVRMRRMLVSCVTAPRAQRRGRGTGLR